MAIIDFNHPDQDISKCEIVTPQPTVPNEATATVPDVTMTTVEETAVETTEAPKATDAPAVTVAPVVEETAKTAIVTETATEVQLPAAAVEVTVKVEDVYTGFNLSASDVKSIEYQIDAGSWTAVTPGAALEIPKAASKMAIRVTKTNGEEVVSEKAIVRTEESTDTTVADSDTTMAPADTTAPVTTDAPESSESSSSNNILLYILGLVILAAIAGFFFKKKSASTK
jgi:LPXTG-motif cell wall-anchored protein